jgi:hypothetical protein
VLAKAHPNLCGLAARAGARVLVFDADAPELDGLPVYDDL